MKKPKLLLARETVAAMPSDAPIGVAITRALLSRLYPNLCRGGH